MCVSDINNAITSLGDHQVNEDRERGDPPMKYKGDVGSLCTKQGPCVPFSESTSISPNGSGRVD